MLEAAERRGNAALVAEREKALELPYFPETLRPLWDHFRHLSGQREFGDMGVRKFLRFSEIAAYQDLVGVRFSAWEIDLITALDHVEMSARARAEKVNETKDKNEDNG